MLNYIFYKKEVNSTNTLLTFFIKIKSKVPLLNYIFYKKDFNNNNFDPYIFHKIEVNNNSVDPIIFIIFSQELVLN